MKRLAAMTIVGGLAVGGTAAAAPVRPSVGLSVGHVMAPVGDDDTFSSTLVTGFAGARLRSWLTVSLRLHHAADEVRDPFEESLDYHDRYVLFLPSVRLGGVAWVELGIGGAYRWRHRADGTDDDKTLPAFDLALGVTPGPSTWTLKPEFTIGAVSSMGVFATFGLKY